MRLPPDGTLPDKAGVFLESLNRNLETLRSISSDFQQKLLDAKGLGLIPEYVSERGLRTLLQRHHDASR